MAKLKFVSSVRPTDYADQLHDTQLKIKRLLAEIRTLETEEKHLQNYLLRFSKGQSFVYDSERFQKVVKIANQSRLILDQEKVQKMLKKRTPYKPSNWTTVKVDYVYK